jgi:hypothetical protein
VKREMEKFVCTAHPSLLCFLSLSFGERKVMVGIVGAFDKKGYDVGSLLSAVQ